MLFKVDTAFGHVIEDTPEGPVYRDDRSPVDPQNPRPCLGCNVRIARGSHDPCIANLPETLNACCGHGLDKTPVHGNPSGYVALKDGRCFRFSGCVGGERIRAAVDAALKGDDLPEGFVFDKDKAWWEGLTEAQRGYVHQNMTRALAELVTEAKGGEPPSAKFLAGEAMWWDGLDEAQKAHVWGGMKAKIAGLVQEALQQPEPAKAS
jgi:hypothetical protein